MVSHAQSTVQKDKIDDVRPSIRENSRVRNAGKQPAGKACTISLHRNTPVKELPIAAVIADRHEQLANHTEQEELSYTVNARPEDGMLETAGDIETGTQYLLNATYRLYRGNYRLAALYWNQEKDPETGMWQLDLEIVSRNPEVTDALFDVIREQLQPQTDTNQNKSAYHI